jgi:hypothetical protein
MLRSRSEACYAKWLVSVLRSGIDVEYEPQQYAVGDYTPDFSFEYEGGLTVIECKPADVSDSYLLYMRNNAELIFRRRAAHNPMRSRLLIHCGSFYEDIPVVQYEFIPDYNYEWNEAEKDCAQTIIAIKHNPFRTEKEWLGQFVSFPRRQDIAQTRWDLR